MNELKAKVKAALKPLPPFKRVVVGLSGGMDSVVLCHVLKSLGYEVIAAHLNHQLRGEEANRDEAFVINLAKAWDLPYVAKKAVIQIVTATFFPDKNIYYGSIGQDSVSEVAKKEKFHLVNIVSTVMPGSCDNIFVPFLEKYSGKNPPEGINTAARPTIVPPIAPHVALR